MKAMLALVLGLFFSLGLAVLAQDQQAEGLKEDAVDRAEVLISRISGASINPCRHFAPKLGGACIHLTNVTFSFPRKLARLIVISRPALITPRSGMINGKRSDSSGLGRRSKTINNRSASRGPVLVTNIFCIFSGPFGKFLGF